MSKNDRCSEINKHNYYYYNNELKSYGDSIYHYDGAHTTTSTSSSQNKAKETAETSDEEEAKKSYTSSKHAYFRGKIRPKLILNIADPYSKQLENQLILRKYAKKVNKSSTEELQRRSLICFLGICVYEYIQRAQFHKNFDLYEHHILWRAGQFAELLQIEKFTANRIWFNHFKVHYNISMSQRKIVLTRTPPASLNLYDIIEYCREKADEETPLSTEKEEDNDYMEVAVKVVNEAAAEEVQSDDIELKPNMCEIEIENPIPIDIDNTAEISNPTADTEELDIKPDITNIKIDSDNEDNEEPASKKALIDVEHDATSDVLYSTNLNSVNIGSEQKQSEDLQEKIIDQQPCTSQEHHKSPESVAEIDHEPCIQVRSYRDALKLLKPLKEFAMLEENFRMISLIAQLEKISKNPPQKVT